MIQTNWKWEGGKNILKQSRNSYIKILSSRLKSKENYQRQRGTLYNYKGSIYQEHIAKLNMCVPNNIQDMWR